MSREPPSCILLGDRSRFLREGGQEGWHLPSLKLCDCPGRCGLLHATLLMTDPEQERASLF